MVLVKNTKFFHPFCLDKIGLEKVFGAVLYRKKAILDENISLINKVAQLTFFRVSQWFWSKI